MSLPAASIESRTAFGSFLRDLLPQRLSKALQIVSVVILKLCFHLSQLAESDRLGKVLRASRVLWP